MLYRRKRHFISCRVDPAFLAEDIFAVSQHVLNNWQFKWIRLFWYWWIQPAFVCIWCSIHISQTETRRFSDLKVVQMDRIRQSSNVYLSDQQLAIIGFSQFEQWRKSVLTRARKIRSGPTGVLPVELVAVRLTHIRHILSECCAWITRADARARERVQIFLTCAQRRETGFWTTWNAENPFFLLFSVPIHTLSYPWCECSCIYVWVYVCVCVHSFILVWC